MEGPHDDEAGRLNAHDGVNARHEVEQVEQNRQPHSRSARGAP